MVVVVDVAEVIVEALVEGAAALAEVCMLYTNDQ